jgi:O-antigen ligase
MKAIRIGICSLIAFEVLALGGVEPGGQVVLELGAAALLLLWGILAIRRGFAEIHWNWLYLPLVGLGALAFAQYGLGISVYPYLTKLELLKWGGGVTLFFLTMECFREADQVKGLVWFLITLGFLVSLFGIVQQFTYNGKLYWTVTVPPVAGPFGPYVDRDDFAGFVELLAPLGIALLLSRAFRREQFTMLLLFTLVPVGAVILSASRAGIIGLAFEFLLLLFLSRSRWIGKRQVLAASALSFAACAFILWLGVREAIQRFEQFAPQQISLDHRVAMYRDAWRVFLDHPWAGTGLGTFRTVYPRYASFYLPDAIVDHAHNDYLELLVDTGLAGGLCGLAFLVLFFWQNLNNLQASRGRLPPAVIAGSLAACAGLLLHSLVDFNLHIPANALIFLLLASLATSAPAEIRDGVPAILQ